MRWLVSKGWHGWLIVVALVVTFDVLAARYGGESMTDAARRWFQNGIARWFVLAAIIFVAVHITVLPERADPLVRGYEWLQRRFGPTSDYVNPPTDQFPPGSG
jgi:hypothetical protein